jgi:ABC-type dipeptide/oligopeptide/nickel transport system permease component
MTRLRRATDNVPVSRSLARVLVRRLIRGVLLVLLVSSAALLLARIAPGDHLADFGVDPALAAAERHRLGLDRPLAAQYVHWLARVVRLDLGPSTRYPGRSVSALIAERAPYSAVLGLAAVVVATAIGIPLGIVSGSRPAAAVSRLTRGVMAVLLSVPPIVLSLALLLVAARTGWLPVGGLPEGFSAADAVRHLLLPVLSLALPTAAALEALQSRSLAEALREPSILAAHARGIPRRRLVWRHAWKLSLKPVLAVYGVMLGALMSGSFVVEYVMTWPGLGRLMYDALVSRDANLVAGCAAAGALFLAAGILAADLGLAAVDPRLEAGR